MSNKVFRLPVLALASREHQRRSVEAIRALLECNSKLPLTGLRKRSPHNPTGEHFFCFEPHGRGRHCHSFRLVEMRNETEEVTLDKGIIEGSHDRPGDEWYGSKGHSYFEVKSRKLGAYWVYSPYVMILC